MFIAYKAVINVSAKRSSASKKAEVNDESTVSGKSEVGKFDYTGYFYDQIEKLWTEIMILQEHDNERRASKSGGP